VANTAAGTKKASARRPRAIPVDRIRIFDS
jgi:hypothetical protein